MAASIWNPEGSSTNIANADNNYKHQTFLVNSTQFTTGIFTLTAFAYQVGTESLLVLINGVDQELNIDYTEINNTTVYIPGVFLGDKVIIRGLVGSEASQSAATSAAAAAASAAAVEALTPANLPLPVIYGGTGQSTKAAGFLALAPTPQMGQVIGSLDGATYVTVPIGNSIVTNVTNNITLTAANIGYIAIAMVSLGLSITLPDATTLPNGGPRAIADNTKGSYPAGVRNNAGVLIGAVAPGGKLYIDLKDNSTSAGVWGINGSGFEPGLITIDSLLSSTYQSTPLNISCTLDSNTSIHFAGIPSGGFAAFIVDNFGKVITTPTLVDAVNGMRPRAVYKITNTSCLVLYTDTATASKAVVLSITGASPSLGITVNTPLVITDTNAFNAEDFTSAPRTAQLTTTSYIHSYISGTNTVVQALTVTGTVITQGAVVNIIAVNSVAGSNVLYPLTNTTALLIYEDGAGPYVIHAVVISIFGNTCTPSAIATGGTIQTTSAPTASVLLSPTKAIVADDTAAGTVYAVTTITITAGVPSFGVRLVVENGLTAVGNLAGYSGNGANRNNPHLWALGTNSAGLWYLDNGGFSRTLVLSESAGTITPGNIYYNSISSAVLTGDEAGMPFPQGISEFLSIRQSAPVAGVVRYRVAGNKINGSNITQGASSQQLDSILLSTSSTAINQSMNRLSSGDYAVTIGGNTGLCGIPVFRTNGDFVNSRGVINCPSMYGAGNSGKSSIFSNRLVLQGNTNWVGQNAAPAGYQIRILNVEIAA